MSKFEDNPFGEPVVDNPFAVSVILLDFQLFEWLREHARCFQHMLRYNLA